jgi:cytochrome c
MPSARSKRWALLWAMLAALAIGIAAAVELSADRNQTLDRIRTMTGGDPDRGHDVITRAGCGTCHQIPGIPGARGQVGPPLKGVSARVYLAGRLDNTPENLAQWIRDPKGVDPLTAMPALGLSEQEARDATAYLYAND